jgi:hypothetical protein
MVWLFIQAKDLILVRANTLKEEMQSLVKAGGMCFRTRPGIQYESAAFWIGARWRASCSIVVYMHSAIMEMMLSGVKKTRNIRGNGASGGSVGSGKGHFLKFIYLCDYFY